MRTVGVDLAAEPATTAVASVEWRPGGARVLGLEAPADDDVVVRFADSADKVGIDCPLGWPEAFVEFLRCHQQGQVEIPDQRPGAWRRSLAYRRTDEVVRDVLGLNPLSVATDRIGLTAMRAALLEKMLAARGHTVDRSGSGLIVEVYPAAGLKHWGLPFRGYKRGRGAVLGELVDTLLTRTPWLDLGRAENRCRTSDHAFDAVMAALLARAAALGVVLRPTGAELDAARREGWIALPIGGLEDLQP